MSRPNPHARGRAQRRQPGFEMYSGEPVDGDDAHVALHVRRDGSKVAWFMSDERDEADQWMTRIAIRANGLTAPMVAQRFCEVLHEWLGADVMAQVVQENRTAPAGCCATGDHCDSNMAMHEAFTDLIGFEPSIVCDEEGNEMQVLWNAAWDMAKAAEFDAGRVA